MGHAHCFGAVPCAFGVNDLRVGVRAAWPRPCKTLNAEYGGMGASWIAAGIACCTAGAAEAAPRAGAHAARADAEVGLHDRPAERRGPLDGHVGLLILIQQVPRIRHRRAGTVGHLIKGVIVTTHPVVMPASIDRQSHSVLPCFGGGPDHAAVGHIHLYDVAVGFTAHVQDLGVRVAVGDG